MKVRTQPGRIKVDTYNLNWAMETRGLDYKALAKRAGLSPQTVWNISSGYRNTCSSKTAGSITEALAMRTDHIFLVELFQMEQKQVA